MASSSAASSSSNSVTLPSSLAFLVSNFHALVNIKLDSSNYLLWRTQVMNALRANGYIEFLDCSKPSPEPMILDSSNTRVTNPEFTLWTLIDNQLLSCITSSLSSATLPHVLGLTHVNQVWSILEQRFNSLSKSHVHELKNKLYNVKMKGSMDDYIDEIRGYDQKLQAIGYHIDDDDLVFYALRGLPEEYKPVRAALNAKGDTMFHELATILKNEESQLLQDDSIAAPKVFLTNQTYNGSIMPTSSSDQTMRNVSAPVVGNGLLGSIPQIYQFPMYQASQSSGPYYPAQSNRNFSNGQSSRGGRGSKIECQICGKTNHTALYCYHRQNLQYQPSFPNSYQSQVSRSKRSDNQTWNGNNQPWNGNNQTWNGNQPWNGGFANVSNVPFMSPSPNVTHQRPSSGNIRGLISQPIGSQGQNAGHTGGYFPSNTYQMQGGPGSATQIPQAFMATAPPIHTGFSVEGQMGHDVSGGSRHSGVSPFNSNWLFDSGASTHVTNDLAHLNQSQTCYTGEGVVIGNGSTLAVNHSGQNNSPYPPQGAMCEGFVSHEELL